MKKVAVIFTGGTISMKVDEALQAAIPALSGEEIMQKVQGIEKIAQIESIHFGSYPGPHVTPELMMKISKLVQELLLREDTIGVVVTHGTDSLEETAYFLDLIIHSEKPVVVTGAMRNSSELGYDGPANLADSISTAASVKSKNKGVLVVMNNEIHGANEVVKTDTLSLDTFQSINTGPLGVVDNGEVIYYRDVHGRQHISTDHVKSNVQLIKAATGMDSSLLKYCVDIGAEGIVIEGMGRGNLPPLMVEGVKYAIENNIPVVLVSRCFKGRALDTYGYAGAGRDLRNIGIILGGNLSGQKARIKLMLILSVAKDMDKIKILFEQDLYSRPSM